MSVKHIKKDTTDGSTYSGWNNVVELDGVVYVRHTEASNKIMGMAIWGLAGSILLMLVVFLYVFGVIKVV